MSAQNVLRRVHDDARVQAGTPRDASRSRRAVRARTTPSDRARTRSSVADLQRSLAFYTTLGYEVLGRVPATEFGTLTMLKLPGDEFVSLELVHDPAHKRVEPGGLHHLVITVEAIRDTIAHVAAGGVEIEPPSSPDGSADFWTAWLTDPDGYRIELVQWPAGHADGMTHDDLSR